MLLLSRQQLLDKYADERVGCDVYTRVMGYLRPRWVWSRLDGEKPTKGSTYNIGKQSEFDERIFFKTQKSMQKHKDK